MATSFVFNGQTITIPGAYSQIKSGIKNPSISLPFGNVLIIDTGSGAGYGGGAGIAGQYSQGADSIYNFDNIADFRDFAKGGLWWLLAQPLFRPAGLGINGVSKISYVKAATTTAATMTYTLQDDGDVSNSNTDVATLNIAVTDEGIIGNGILTSGVLTKGFAGKVSAGIIDTTKFVFTFYRGTFKGLDQNNLPFDGIIDINTTALVVAKSPEVSNVQDLITWMNQDFLFNKHFKLTSSTIFGSGVLNTSDITTYSAYNLASGGTETYADPALLANTLTACNNLDVNFIFADQYGANAQSAANYSILANITTTSKFKPELYVGAGNDVNDFVSLSQATAVYYNNDAVTVVHGGVLKQSKQGLRKYNVMYHTAAVLGREAGLEPQVPITFKNLDFDGMQHTLNDKEVTQALNKGVIVTRLENGTFDIVKGVNSLQTNTFLVNDDGTTSSKQIKRIARQLNKEIIVNSKADLLKNPQGVNRNTLSIQDLNAWTVGYLKTKQCTIDVDNLILSFQDITISRVSDGYFISYKFVPNSEISFLFYTGLIVGI
jgi:hypothetical protein